MAYVLYCIDKPDRLEARMALRRSHLDYACSRRQHFRYGGPLINDSGQPRGSLMVLDLPDRAALDAHMRGDPFFSADLFESVTVWQTRQVFPEQMPGALLCELERARDPVRVESAVPVVESAAPAVEAQPGTAVTADRGSTGPMPRRWRARGSRFAGVLRRWFDTWGAVQPAASDRTPEQAVGPTDPRCAHRWPITRYY